MESLRNEDGFIDITNFEHVKENCYKYKGKTYYFKICTYYDMYNELIAEELAKDFGLLNAHYDLAQIDGFKGVISEDFIKDNKVIKISDLQKMYANKYNITDEIDNLTNLSDLWNILEDIYNSEVVCKLMRQLVKIFIFDVFISNEDRHNHNFVLLQNDKDINFEIYDNQNFLYTNFGYYCLATESKDFMNAENVFTKFLNLSSSSYKKYIQDKLWIISEENIESVFKRVEKRIKAKIKEDVKFMIKSIFNQNKELIINEINRAKRKR